MGTANAGERDPLIVLEEALAGGITHFQLREKGPSALKGTALEHFARQCQALCQTYQVPFIINDDVDLACSMEADGVHVGQDDLDCVSVRGRIGENKILGVSAHSIEEAEKAREDGADYVGMGPVYGTRSKKDAKTPAGTNTIHEVTRLFPDLPVVGIGGITPEKADAVWRAGAAGVAVISSLAQAEDIKEQVRLFKKSYNGELLT